MASALYEAQRASDSAVAVWTVHIGFPAFEGLSAKDFYWSTADNIELEDGNIYVRHLMQTPRGRHQTDRGNDYAEIVVSNPDNALYQEILPYEDLIEKCSIVIRECFEIETDLYESEIRFVGFLKEFTVSEAEKNINLTAISDLSRSGFLVGNRILTRQKCGTTFNVNGLLPPTESICGWQTEQGGNPLFCSLKLKGVDGCEAHNNSARFYAVPGIGTATVEIVPGDDTGFPGGGSGSCFGDSVRVLMADGSKKRISQVEAGDAHQGFDVMNGDRLIAGTVLQTFEDTVDEIATATFDTGTVLEVVPHHLFYLGSRLFTPVGALGARPALGMDWRRNKAKSQLSSYEVQSCMEYVYNLRTSTNNYIVTDEDATFYYFVHNAKPLYGF